MAKNVLGRFQTTEFTTWKGLTKDNHLQAVFHGDPQKASNFMIKLLAATDGKTLESMISAFPTREFENETEYTWEIIGSSNRNIPLVEARNENGEVVTASSGMIGAGTAPFYLVFGEDWFADGRHTA